jgi:glycine/D-amino acid oxidase-like deaminating enzyme
MDNTSRSLVSSRAESTLIGQFTPVDSYWERSKSAVATFAPIEGDIMTGVVILGGGATGLTAAHFLAERGIESVVVEAASPGWGCSGRSGGMVVARYKRGFASLALRYGDETARHLHRQILAGIDQLETLVARYAIECGFVRSGHLTAAHSKRGLENLAADVGWLARNGDRAPRLIDAAEAARQLGTREYIGGYLDMRSGRIHQLNYVRGLAAGLAGQGVRISAGSPARSFEQTPAGVTVSTDRARITAQHAIVATNAYTALAPAMSHLARRIVPVSSSLIATAPLPADIVATILPSGWVAGDTKHLMNSFALLPGGRLLYCGRADITGRADNPGVYRRLEQQMARAFPQVSGAAIETRWSGMVAVTLDDFPHVGSEGRTHYAIGCGGRGIVLSGVMGRALAAIIAGERVDLGPITRNPFRPIPFHSLRVPGMKLMAGVYRMRDLFGL